MPAAPARVAALAALVVTVGGCALFTCRPATIVVVDKEVQARLERRVIGLHTDPLGRVGEDVRYEIVREYRVRGDDGAWYRTGAAEWAEATPGLPLTVCR